MTGLADALPKDVEVLQALILAERAAHAAETERLRQIIMEMQRHRFGRRAETLPLDQLELALEDAQQEAAVETAGEEARHPERKAATAAKRRSNCGALPEHLPRIETVVDIEDKACPCCAGALHLIGEDRAERLDIVPGQLGALVVRRNEGPDGLMSVKGARLWRASRSDGEAALDPQRPARQRLGKRFRAKPDRF